MQSNYYESIYLTLSTSAAFSKKAWTLWQPSTEWATNLWLIDHFVRSQEQMCIGLMWNHKRNRLLLFTALHLIPSLYILASQNDHKNFWFKRNHQNTCTMFFAMNRPTADTRKLLSENWFLSSGKYQGRGEPTATSFSHIP
jgi:hypothetical protein